MKLSYRVALSLSSVLNDKSHRPHLYIRRTSEEAGEGTVKAGLVYLSGIVVNSG
jgi:hypothetical protein